LQARRFTPVVFSFEWVAHAVTAVVSAIGENRLMTRINLVLLAVLWIMLLIIATGLKRNSWFLLAVGGAGILHNIYVAGAVRRPENFGIHLRFEPVIGNLKVMRALYALEEAYSRVGRTMRVCERHSSQVISVTLKRRPGGDMRRKPVL
jgi:hypothetical protein